MILYNVTVNVDDDIHHEWLKWMQQVHIPEVMASGKFVGHRFFRLAFPAPEEGSTYAIQYMAASLADYEDYREHHAPALQKATNDRYANKFVAFRTILEEVI